MKLVVCAGKSELGSSAADAGQELIRDALARQGYSNVILATGASQFEMLQRLGAAKSIDWSKVTFFHLDEYVGMSDDHPASFRRYLRERFVNQLPQQPKGFRYINAEGDCDVECKRLGELIRQVSIDVAFIGIGENGHLAFNDPPADLQTDEPYIVVQLDDACRQQQFGEGWFESFESVPCKAISMSIRQIMKSKAIICSVPDNRKAEAVFNTLTQPISPEFPSTVLTEHPHATIFVDEPAASLVSIEQRQRWQ